MIQTSRTWCSVHDGLLLLCIILPWVYYGFIMKHMDDSVCLHYFVFFCVCVHAVTLLFMCMWSCRFRRDLRLMLFIVSGGLIIHSHWCLLFCFRHFNGLRLFLCYLWRREATRMQTNVQDWSNLFVLWNECVIMLICLYTWSHFHMILNVLSHYFSLVWCRWNDCNLDLLL